MSSPNRSRHILSDLFDEWLAWAARSRLRPIVTLARTVRKHAAGILAYLDTKMTNGPVEGINNKLRVLARRGVRLSLPRRAHLDAVPVLRRHRTGTASTHCYLRRLDLLRAELALRAKEGVKEASRGRLVGNLALPDHEPGPSDRA